MDAVDRKLITLLQKNARMPLKELASAVHLSSPAVSARISKMEREGIIRSYQASIDKVKLGFPIKAFINLELVPTQKSEFYPFIQECPNVLQCDCITGQYSMLLQVAYADTSELDAFIGKLQQFGNTKTQIVFSTPVEHRGVRLMPESELQISSEQ